MPEVNGGYDEDMKHCDFTEEPTIEDVNILSVLVFNFHSNLLERSIIIHHNLPLR